MRIITLVLVLILNTANIAFAAVDPLDLGAGAKKKPILSFANKKAMKYQKIMTVGQVEILEFADPVSLAHYGVGEESLNYLELDKLQPERNGYKKFILKAKKPGYGELTFRSGKDLIKVEVVVQNDYKVLENQLNNLFGIKGATEEERIKVSPAAFIGNVSDEANSAGYLYLTGWVDNPKNAVLAVSFAANAVGDSGVKIFSNPGGQLRLKDIEGESNGGGGTTINVGGGDNDSFVASYDEANKLIDTKNIHRDLVLSSENERVVSAIKIKEPARYAVKVRFLELDARFLDQFNSAISFSGVGQDVNAGLGSPNLVPPVVTSGGVTGTITETLFNNEGLINNNILNAGLQGVAGGVLSGNLLNGSLKIFENARLNATVNDLLNEGVLRVANEFSLVSHSGDTVSVGKGVRFPVPQQNNNVGGNTVSVEYIPIGFQGELKVTDLKNGLIDAQLASRLTTAEPANVSLNGFPIPVFKEEYINSGVLLKDGQEVILNAFLTESENIAKATSPIGRLIPFLGKGKRKERAKSLLFVTVKVDEIESSSTAIAGGHEFRLPHANIDKNRNIYNDYSRQLRSKNITDTLDLGVLNKRSENDRNLGSRTGYDSDPLNLDDIEVLPGIKPE